MCTKPSAGGTENVKAMVSTPSEGERCAVFLFREFLRHRPKHMRGLGPLFLALSNFTTDADVWYRPVRLSEATLGSIVRQMANAARTMGMGGSENNPNYKVEIKTGKIERIAAPPAVLQPLRRGEQGLDQESADYLSSADASPVRRGRSYMRQVPSISLSDWIPLTNPNILPMQQGAQLIQQPVSTSSSQLFAIPPPTSSGLLHSSPIQGPCIPGLSFIKTESNNIPQFMIAQPTIASPPSYRPTLIPNVVIQSPQQQQTSPQQAAFPVNLPITSSPNNMRFGSAPGPVISSPTVSPGGAPASPANISPGGGVASSPSSAGNSADVMNEPVQGEGEIRGCVIDMTKCQ
eukprot:sb/3466272/